MRHGRALGCPWSPSSTRRARIPGLEAEERGQADAIAENLRSCGGCAVPVVVRRHRRGRQRRRAGARRRRPAADAGERHLLGHQPGGLRGDPVARSAAAHRGRPRPAPDRGSLLRLGVVDGVVPEPAGGSEADPPAALRCCAPRSAPSSPRSATSTSRACSRCDGARFRPSVSCRRGSNGTCDRPATGRCADRMSEPIDDLQLLSRTRQRRWLAACPAAGPRIRVRRGDIVVELEWPTRHDGAAGTPP